MNNLSPFFWSYVSFFGTSISSSECDSLEFSATPLKTFLKHLLFYQQCCCQLNHQLLQLFFESLFLMLFFFFFCICCRFFSTIKKFLTPYVLLNTKASAHVFSKREKSISFHIYSISQFN